MGGGAWARFTVTTYNWKCAIYSAVGKWCKPAARRLIHPSYLRGKGGPHNLGISRRRSRCGPGALRGWSRSRSRPGGLRCRSWCGGGPRDKWLIFCLDIKELKDFMLLITALPGMPLAVPWLSIGYGSLDLASSESTPLLMKNI